MHPPNTLWASCGDVLPPICLQRLHIHWWTPAVGRNVDTTVESGEDLWWDRNAWSGFVLDSLSMYIDMMVRSKHSTSSQLCTCK